MGTLLKYLPLIIETIITVNGIIGRGKGAAKKKIVLDAVTEGIRISSEIDNRHVQAISRVIDGTVQALNDAGVFETSTKKEASSGL